jgi:zinc transport system substrate-binding protein
LKKLWLLFILCIAMAAPACTGKPAQPAGKPKIAATIFPLYDISRNIVGDKMEVVLILPPGASPHTFELTPQSVERLQGVSLIFKIGHGLDDWTQNIAGFIANEQTVVVDQGIKFIYSDEGDREGGADKGGGVNPHYWLSIENAQIIAKNIADKVIASDAANEQTYRANLEAYVGKLEKLKAETAEKLKPFAGAKLITFHDSFVYYAQEFNLQIAGTIEPFPGKQPTPRYLAELQKKIEDSHIRVLFTEPQLSAESVQAFVEDLGLRLYVLDPLGGIQGRDNFIALIQYDTNTVAEALAYAQQR